jgi:4-phospho-D-threonate 3-dehydrogenase / 4-phospho-D-erythronate 3-dehydrogenase
VSFPQPIAVAVGDPAGVGPNISIVAAYRTRSRVRSAIFGDVAQLLGEARTLHFDLACFVERDEASLESLALGQVALIDTGRVSTEAIACHAPTEEGGEAQLQTLRRAAQLVRAGAARALVTGPTSKAAISSAGHAFVGQTEFLARLDGLDDDDVTMLFLGPRLKVALVTTHLGIADVSPAITGARVARSTRHLAAALLRLHFERAPKLAICGLNPHAGEQGMFGREEIDVISPAIERLRAEEPFASGRVALTGPVPAESLFRAAQRGDVDGVVAMFHDQATIASKLLDWGSAVNTTWGLSFLRTSVDHGVAYDAARRGTAEHDGMLAALDLALMLTREHEEHG